MNRRTTKANRLSALSTLSVGLLTVSTATLLPTDAQAVNFSFGSKAEIGLFRGAGSLLGFSGSTGTSGIDILASRIDRTFSDYALTTSVFDSYEGNIFSFNEVGSHQATDFFNSSFINTSGSADGNFVEPVLGLIGYSGGGLSAIRTAKNLAPKSIDLLVQIESYDPLTGNSQEDETLPTNVTTGINYYQNRNRFNIFSPGFDPIDLQGARNVSGSQNINAELLLGNRNLTHRSIINNAGLQDRIVQDIQTNLLNNLTFDRARQLTLDDKSMLKNNLLRLTPGGESRKADVILTEPISSSSSFQSRLEFRLPFETTSEELVFWLGPDSQADGDRQLTLKFDPILPGESIYDNKLSLLTPGQGADSEDAGFALNGRNPITAWIDYDSKSKRYEVFISDRAIKPQQAIFSRTIDLSALGSNTYFGFRAAGADDGQYADLLSWQLQSEDAAESTNLFANLLIEADASSTEPAVDSVALLTRVNTQIRGSDDETAVPEPSLLLGLGLLSCGIWFIKRIQEREPG